MGTISSADGFPYGMAVDRYLRAQVRAVTMPTLTEASLRGDSFCISSGKITLNTTTGYSGIIQVKNTSSRKMHLSIMCLGGDIVSSWWKVIKNPTDAGTLWASGTVVTPENINFSSGTTFPAIGGVKKGFDAATAIGSTLNEFSVGIGEFQKILEGSIIIGPTNSIALMCHPSSAGGSVHASLLGYFQD